ncbi:VOC family protein [Rhodococcus koreensis]
MPALALQAIRLNVSNLELATQFYKSIGMVEDIGMRRTESSSHVSVLSTGCPGETAPAPSVSLRWPSDPHMHINLVQYDAGAPTAGWPRKPGQFGSTVSTLLVSDVSAEVERLRPDTPILTEPVVTERLLGSTRSAFVEDPDGNIVELIELKPGRAWDLSRCSVFGAERTFLHFELNTDNYKAVSEFYEGFGFAHNAMNDVRPGAEPEVPEVDPFIAIWGAPLISQMDGVNFLRLGDDPSEMHLEIMGWKEGGLQNPTSDPVWHQRGVMRYCFKTRNLAALLSDLEQRGVQIFLKDAQASLNWGDSEWFFFADPDGNILTFEEWFPAGRWGQRQ